MNWGIRILQTLALPLGYVTIYIVIICELPEKVHTFLKKTQKIFPPAKSRRERSTRRGTRRIRRAAEPPTAVQ